MTTVLERPFGVPSPSQGAHAHHPQSNSIEIIDVDMFEETPTNPQPRRPAPRLRPRREPSDRETISLIDSDDDEVEIVASRVRSGHNVDRNHSHRRFISPAPRDPSAPPPVPAIPRRYTGQTSFPIRQQQSHPPVIPIAEPMAFERSSMPPVAGPSNPTRRVVAERGAPASHHSPAMGLGGALISSNRNQALQRQREADIAATTIRRRRDGGQGIAFRSGRNFINPFAVTDRDDDMYIHMLLHPFIGADSDGMPARWRQSLNFLRTSEPRDEHYRQSYTHPTPPEPGFTFDFAAPSADDESASNGHFFPPTSREEPIILDDDEDDARQPTAGPSTSTSKAESSTGPTQLNSLLVCARCLDPLVLNASLNPEEGQFKRIWALRCGHLIDEKCLNILGQPPIEEAIPDKKGKGKARAPSHRNNYGSTAPEQQQQQPQADAAEPTDIRSRLRSRRSVVAGDASAQGPSATAALPPTQGDGQSAQTPSPPAKKRKVTHRKPKIEAEYEWACPVAGCGGVHVSVRIEGIWGPEKETPSSRGAGKASGVWTEPRGAIAAFA